jgi:hypothetical protein
MSVMSGNFNLLDKFAFQLEKQTMLTVISRSKKYIFFSLILIGAVFACKTEDCLSTHNNYLLVGFIKSDTLENGNIAYSPLDTMFYSVAAVGNDSVFYDPGDKASTFKLPVNPAADFTSFRFEMIDSIAYDSLTMQKIYYADPNPQILSVSYHRSERVITEDCGIEITFTQIKIEESTFQDTLINNSLSRFNLVNVEVFF